MATDKTAELSELVKGKAEQVRSQAAARVEDARSQVADKTSDIRGQIAAKTEDLRGQLADNAPGKVREAAARGAAGAREHSLPVAIAVGAIVVAVLIVGRLRRR